MTTNCIFFMDRGIRGIAAVGGEIFVIRYKQSHVSVYNSHSPNVAKYDIAIPDIKLPQSLAGCFYNKALYISDQGLKSIHRVDLTNNSVTLWKLKENKEPRGLAVTAEHRLLVTVWTDDTSHKSGVVEYTNDGGQVREMLFDISINWAAQTLQLSSDQFIVCHGSGDSLHRVCVINTEGQIIKFYGGEKGGGLSFLNHPYSMAIHDNSKYVFVADHGNNRILLLDTDLTYLGQVHTPPDFRWPSHLYFDSLTGRLLVDSKESLLSSGCTAKIMKHYGRIQGVTVVDDEIYVLIYLRRRFDVEVYDAYSLVATRSIVIPDIQLRRGFAGCSYTKALYIGDQGLKSIYRVDLTNESVTCWKKIEHHEQRGLSVTAEHTLLVTVCRDNGGECGVVEYTSEGKLVREIWFGMYFQDQWCRSKQPIYDKYIVCHWHNNYRMGVSVINTKGQIMRSFGGDDGRSKDDDRDLCPSFAIDARSKYVFVTHSRMKTVLMLDTDLNYLGQVHTRFGLELPNPRYFDSSSDRLFVDEGYGGLLVISPPD